MVATGGQGNKGVIIYTVVSDQTYTPYTLEGPNHFSHSSLNYTYKHKYAIIYKSKKNYPLRKFEGSQGINTKV